VSATIGRAAHVVLAAIVLGILGQLLFFDVAIGVNFPIAIGLLVASGWLLKRPMTRVGRVDLWLGPAAVAFAAFAAIRADTTIVLLDALTGLGLAGAALASYGRRTVVSRPFRQLLGLGLAVGGWVLAGAVPALAATRRRLPAGPDALRRARPALPVLRGLLIAVPVVLVFMSLFSAADAVFARVLEDLTRVEIDLGSGAGRAALAAVLGWLTAGGLALAASRPVSRPRPGAAVDAGWRLGTTETVTVLVAVDAIFVVFVALQGAYLFGGLDTLAAAGLTYSEYARRGFFELVAVAILAGGLVVVLERVVRHRSAAVIGAAVGLALLTGVVLASAAVRMRLYQEAYGWTELRLYVLATIVVLAVALAALVVVLLRDRVRWIGHVVLASGLVVGLGLNVLGPVRFITEQNVARALDPSLVPAHGISGLDTWYAVTLGDDAIPDLVRALPAVEEPEAGLLRDELRIRLRQLQADPGLRAWQAWNRGREEARSALEAAAARGALD